MPEPVAEGALAGAVVWRRTTVPATKRTLGEVSAQIKTTIYRGARKRTRKLIDGISRTKVKDYDAEPLKIIEFPGVRRGAQPSAVGPGGAGGGPDAVERAVRAESSRRLFAARFRAAIAAPGHLALDKHLDLEAAPGGP